MQNANKQLQENLLDIYNTANGWLIIYCFSIIIIDLNIKFIVYQ